MEAWRVMNARGRVPRGNPPNWRPDGPVAGWRGMGARWRRLATSAGRSPVAAPHKTFQNWFDKDKVIYTCHNRKKVQYAVPASTKQHSNWQTCLKIKLNHPLSLTHCVRWVSASTLFVCLILFFYRLLVFFACARAREILSKSGALCR